MTETNDARVLTPDELTAAYQRVGFFGVPLGHELEAATDFCRQLTKREDGFASWREVAWFMLHAAMYAADRADVQETDEFNMATTVGREGWIEKFYTCPPSAKDLAFFDALRPLIGNADYQRRMMDDAWLKEQPRCN